MSWNVQYNVCRKQHYTRKKLNGTMYIQRVQNKKKASTKQRKPSHFIEHLSTKTYKTKTLYSMTSLYHQKHRQTKLHMWHLYIYKRQHLSPWNGLPHSDRDGCLAIKLEKIVAGWNTKSKQMTSTELSTKVVNFWQLQWKVKK